MIYIWLILLALVYVVVAIVVGKVCAINSRWEKSVDQLESPSPQAANDARREPDAKAGPVPSFASSAETGDIPLGAASSADGD